MRKQRFDKLCYNKPVIVHDGNHKEVNVMNMRTGDAIRVWMITYKKNSVKESTYTRLQTSFKLMDGYSISKVAVSDLTASVVQRYLNQLVEDGYALTTVKKQYNLVTAFVRHLIAERYDIAPLYMSVKLPIENVVKQKKREVIAYNSREQLRIKQTASQVNSIGSKAVILLLESGMRIGELLALTWRDVQWERRAIRIHSTMVNAASRKKCYIQEGAKSKSSNRTIPLSKSAMDVLESMYKGKDDGLIFVIETGEPCGYNLLCREIEEICAEANVKYSGMHVFRHTFATNCYYKGCEIKILSKLLGHANVGITYNTYIHLYGDALDEMRTIVDG